MCGNAVAVVCDGSGAVGAPYYELRLESRLSLLGQQEDSDADEDGREPASAIDVFAQEYFGRDGIAYISE